MGKPAAELSAEGGFGVSSGLLATAAEAALPPVSHMLVDLITPFATPDNKHVGAMLADLIKGPFAGKKFKFHHTDAATGKREAREIGG